MPKQTRDWRTEVFQKVKFDGGTNTGGLFDSEVMEIVNQAIDHTLGRVEEVIGSNRGVDSEEPFIPSYKPDGMSEEEYAYEIHRHERNRSDWAEDIAYNQAKDEIRLAIKKLLDE